MRRAVAAIFVLFVLVCPHVAQAAAFDLNDASWEGCLDLLELARKELGAERVIVTSELDWAELDEDDGVLVLHPTVAVDAEEATAFMKQGGRLAVVDDYGEGEKLLKPFDIERRSLPSRPTRYLRDRPAFAVAEPVHDKSGSELLGLHPTVVNIESGVVLNHGTGLRHPDLTPVLEVRRDSGKPIAVAVAGQVESGRLFAMGDPSVFINQMMRYPGNRQFASGIVKYLADGDSTNSRRRGRLFILANGFGQRGSFGGATPLKKELDRKLQQLAEALEELRDDGFPWWLHVAVAALAAMLVLWWCIRRLVKLYKGRSPRFARQTPLVAQGGVSGRAAVLSTAASPPALALLELRGALGEALSYHLEQPVNTPLRDLLQQADQSGAFPEGLARQLTSVVALMDAAETSVVGGLPMRVSRSEVLSAGRLVLRALDLPQLVH